jgi:catechol 2,3-dioxygenase-like lactoylglutathione lyase family enzyme
MLRGIDHLYAETRRWEESVAFWEGLGFRFEEQWGSDGHRAGRLRAADARVVLAEVDDGTPALTVVFDLNDADSFEPGTAVEVTARLAATHWGTRWIRVRDPDGRSFALEEAPEGAG